MDGVSACKSREHHFNPEEDDALRKDEPTTKILDKVRQHANVGGPGVEVRGDDKSWRETKTEQQSHFGLVDGMSVGHAAVEALHFADFHKVETALGAGGGMLGAGVVIGGTLAGFALGVHEWNEAHIKGEEQNAALAKDELHVAMLTQLDLPAGYKAEQFKERAQAGQSAQSVTQKMATPFSTIDKPLVATMQLHADRGMNAARDFIASGLSKEKFLAANPNVAQTYAKDPAFHDGFDGLVWAKSHLSPKDYANETTKLDARDCWYTQSNVAYRI